MSPIPIGTTTSEGVWRPRRRKRPGEKKIPASSGIITGRRQPIYVGEPVFNPYDFDMRSGRSDIGTNAKKIAFAWAEASGGRVPKTTLISSLLRSGTMRDMSVRELTDFFRAALLSAGTSYSEQDVVEALIAGQNYAPEALDWQALASFAPQSAAEFYAGPGVVSEQPYTTTPIATRTGSHVTEALLEVVSEHDPQARKLYLRGMPISHSRLELPEDAPAKIVHSQADFELTMASGRGAIYLPAMYGYRNLAERARVMRRTRGIPYGTDLSDKSPAMVVRDLQGWIKSALVDAAKYTGDDSLTELASEIEPNGVYNEADMKGYSRIMAMRYIVPAAIFSDDPEQFGYRAEAVEVGKAARRALQSIGVPGVTEDTDLRSLLAERLGGATVKGRALFKDYMLANWIASRAPGQSEQSAMADFYRAFGEQMATPAVREAASAVAEQEKALRLEGAVGTVGQFYRDVFEDTGIAHFFGEVKDAADYVIGGTAHIALEGLTIGHAEEAEEALSDAGSALWAGIKQGGGKLTDAYNWLLEQKNRALGAYFLSSTQYDVISGEAAQARREFLTEQLSDDEQLVEVREDRHWYTEFATLLTPAKHVIWGGIKAVFTDDDDEWDNTKRAFSAGYAEIEESATVSDVDAWYRATGNPEHVTEHPVFATFEQIGSDMLADVGVGKTFKGLSLIPGVRTAYKTALRKPFQALVPWVDDATDMVLKNPNDPGKIASLFPSIPNLGDVERLAHLSNINRRFDFAANEAKVAAKRSQAAAHRTDAATIERRAKTSAAATDNVDHGALAAQNIETAERLEKEALAMERALNRDRKRVTETPADLVVSERWGKINARYELLSPKADPAEIRELAREEIKELLALSRIEPGASVISERLKYGLFAAGAAHHPLYRSFVPRMFLMGQIGGRIDPVTQGQEFVKWTTRAAGMSEKQVNDSLARYVRAWTRTLDAEPEDRAASLIRVLDETEDEIAKFVDQRGLSAPWKAWRDKERRKSDLPHFLRLYFARRGPEGPVEGSLVPRKPLMGAEATRLDNRIKKLSEDESAAVSNAEHLEQDLIPLAQSNLTATRNAQRESGALFEKAAKQRATTSFIGRSDTQVELRGITRRLTGKDAPTTKAISLERVERLREILNDRLARVGTEKPPKVKGRLQTAEELQAGLDKLDNILAFEKPLYSYLTALPGQLSGTNPLQGTLVDIVRKQIEAGYPMPKGSSVENLLNTVGRNLERMLERNREADVVQHLRSLSKELGAAGQANAADVAALRNWLRRWFARVDDPDHPHDAKGLSALRKIESGVASSKTAEGRLPGIPGLRDEWRDREPLLRRELEKKGRPAAEIALLLEGERLALYKVGYERWVEILKSQLQKRGIDHDEPTVSKADETIDGLLERKPAEISTQRLALEKALEEWNGTGERSRGVYAKELRAISETDPEIRRWALRHGITKTGKNPAEYLEEVTAAMRSAHQESAAAHASAASEIAKLQRARKHERGEATKIESRRRDLQTKLSNMIPEEDVMVSQPLLETQLAQWYYPRDDYNLMMIFNSGKMARAIETFNRTKNPLLLGFSPDQVTQAYKSMILAQFATMVRINVGDEYVRPLAEGINPFDTDWAGGRLRKGGAHLSAKQLEERGWMAREFSKLRDSADNLTAQSHIAYTASEGPKYRQALPHFRELVNNSRMTEIYRGVRGKNRAEMREAMLDFARQDPTMQSFLKRTYRIGDDAVADLTEEWIDALLDFYKSLEGRLGTYFFEGAQLSKEMLKGDQSQLPIVIGRLHQQRGAHFLSRLGRGQTKLHEVLYGSLDSMSTYAKKRLYTQRFNDTFESLAISRSELSEIARARIATNDACMYVERTLYRAMATQGETLLRNAFLFLPAYRQFWVYWGQVFAKHPFIFGGVFRELQKMPDAITLNEDTPLIGGLMEAAENALTGIFNVEDLEMGMTLNPRSALFLTGGTSGSEESILVQNLPGAGPLITLPASIAQQAWPEHFAGLYRMPLLSFSRPGQPVNRVLDRIIYAATGETAPWPIGSESEVRERMVLNLLRMQYTQYYRRLQEHPEDAPLLTPPDAQRAVRELRLIEGLSGVAKFVSPFTISIAQPDLAKRMATERTYLETMRALDGLGWYPGVSKEGKLGKEAAAQVKELLKIRDAALKDDPFYAKVVRYFEADRDKQAEMLEDDRALVPWVVGTHAYDVESDTALTNGEFYEQWLHPTALIRPVEMQQRIADKLETIEDRRLGADIESQVAQRWATFKEAAARSGLLEGSSRYIQWQREFEQGVGDFAGRGLMDLSVPTADLPGVWRSQLSDDREFTKLSEIFEDPSQLVRSLSVDVPNDIPSLGEGTMAFATFLSRLPYGELWLEQTRSFPTFVRKSMERHAKLMRDYIDIAEMRKFYFTIEDWKTIGFEVGQEVIDAQDRLNLIYERFQSVLKKNGYKTMSKEYVAARATMIAEQRALINANPEVKKVLGGSVADRLRRSKFTEPTIYGPEDWLALRNKTETKEDDVIHKIEQVEWDAFVRCRKEWNKWDAKRYPTLDAFVAHWRPQLSPAMRGNLDELVRAWTWNVVLSAAGKGRDALANAYNKTMKSTGYSPQSKAGEAVAAWVRGIVAQLSGGRKYRKGYFVKRGQNPSFWDEWVALNERGDFAAKLIDWTY